MAAGAYLPDSIPPHARARFERRRSAGVFVAALPGDSAGPRRHVRPMPIVRLTPTVELPREAQTAQPHVRLAPVQQLGPVHMGHGRARPGQGNDPLLVRVALPGRVGNDPRRVRVANGPVLVRVLNDRARGLQAVDGPQRVPPSPTVRQAARNTKRSKAPTARRIEALEPWTVCRRIVQCKESPPRCWRLYAP